VAGGILTTGINLNPTPQENTTSNVTVADDTTTTSRTPTMQELKSTGRNITFYEKAIKTRQKDIDKLRDNIKELRSSGASSERLQQREEQIAQKEARIQEYRDILRGYKEDLGDRNYSIAKDLAPKHFNTAARTAAKGVPDVLARQGYSSSDYKALTPQEQQEALRFYRNPALQQQRPGVYGVAQNPVIITRGKASTTTKINAFNTNNQALNDPDYYARQRDAQNREAMQQARTGKANYQDITGKTFKVDYLIQSNEVSNATRMDAGTRYTRNTDFLQDSPRLQAVEKTSEFVTKYQKGVEQRQQNLNVFLSRISGGKGVPFEYRSTAGKIAQTGVGIGSLGMFYVASFADSSILAGQKSFLYTGALLTPETRTAAKQELTATLPVLKQVYTDPYVLTSAAAFAGIGVASGSFKNNIAVRTVLPKLYPEKFITQEKSGITFIEDVTVPTKLGELKSFEGKTDVPTIHVTTAKTPDSFITTSQPGAGGFRQQFQLYNFYKSSPEITPSGLSPRAYLGYAGIVKETSTAQSSGRLIFGNPTVRLLVFNDKITPTPRSMAMKNIFELNRFQIKKSGTTQIPAENLKLLSTEGQFISPSRYVEVTPAKMFGIIKSTEKSIPGYENSPGSVISRSGDSTFFFYRQELPKLFGIIPRSKYIKFEIVPSKTSPVESTATVPQNTKVIDVASYTKEFSSPSKRVSSFRSNISPIISSSKKSSVINSSVPSYAKSAVSIQSSPKISASRFSSLSSTSSGVSSVSRSSSPSISSVFSSVSKSPSPSPSPTPSIIPSSPPPPVLYPEYKRQPLKKKRKSLFSPVDRVFAYTPTLSGVGFVGEPVYGAVTTSLALRPVKRGKS